MNIEARGWATHGATELTAAINDIVRLLVTAEDGVASGLLGNVRAAVARADEHLMRAKILFDGK